MQNMMPKSWNEFKEIVITRKGLSLNFDESIDRYEIYAQEGLFLWSYTLPKDGGAAVVDFETNHKAGANH